MPPGRSEPGHRGEGGRRLLDVLEHLERDDRIEACRSPGADRLMSSSTKSTTPGVDTGGDGSAFADPGEELLLRD